MKKVCIFTIVICVFLLGVSCSKKIDLEKEPLSDITINNLEYIISVFRDQTDIQRKVYIEKINHQILGKKIKWSHGCIESVRENTYSNSMKSKGKYVICIKYCENDPWNYSNYSKGGSDPGVRFEIFLFTDDSRAINFNKGTKLNYEGIIESYDTEHFRDFYLYPVKIY